jgi:hypothetical protein
MAADKSRAVQVRGLAEFQRELRKLDLAKDLRLANKEAAEVVASAARARARGGVAAKTAPSVKAAAEQRRAKVTLGGAAYPFAMGAEFGGQGRPTTMQFEPHRGTQGYFLYPAVRDTREQFIDTYARVLDQLMRRAFPN